MTSMTEASILRVYVGQAARHEGRPLYEWLVEEARRRGMAGATVYRGVLGFGGNCLVRTSWLLRLSEDLPAVVEIVDLPERVAAFVPLARAAVREGTLVVERAQAIFCTSPRVRDVMRAEVCTLPPDMPLAQAVERLLERGVTAAPVMDGGRLAGMLTGGDLLHRAGLALRLDLLALLPRRFLEPCLGPLTRAGLLVRDVMTASAEALNVKTPLAEALSRLVAGGFKRMPVLDDVGDLAGIVGRADLLSRLDVPLGQRAVRAGDLLADAVPTVPPGLPLPEVLARIMAAPRRLAVVVDAGGQPVGVVSDRGLLEQCLGCNKPELVEILVAVFSGDVSKDVHAVGTARNASRCELPAVYVDATLEPMLRLFAEKRTKLLLVLDRDGRFAGLVDRNAALGRLAAQARPDARVPAMA